MKRSIKTLLAGGALLAVAGTANAANLDINIYGASAQFNFWKTAAGTFITSASGFNCTGGTVPANGSPAFSGSTHGIIQGLNCQNLVATPGDSVTIRFSNKASYDGVYAVLGSVNANADNGCGTTAGAWPTAPVFQRAMADLPATGNTVLTTSCQPVTLGASDVPAYGFIQTSQGKTKGPNTSSTATVSRSFGGTGIDTTSLTHYMASPGDPYAQPVKVPFSFWVNNNVTAKTCDTGPRTGDYCNTALDCSTTTSPTNGTCNGSGIINNMSREMANTLFSGQIKNWQDFGAGFANLPVVLCYRHAGSGTMATLDLAVMNHGGWGKPMLSKEVATTSSKNPVVAWFNDGSGDEAYCLQNVSGSVGYLDADFVATAYPSITGPIKYNGSMPSAANIIQGIYDFWADQSLYIPNAIDATSKGAVDALIGYLNNGPSLDAVGFHQYWAATNEMKVKKDLESSYPHR